MVDVIIAALGALLIVAGIALLSIPAALIAAGSLLVLIATVFDFTRSGRSSE